MKILNLIYLVLFISACDDPGEDCCTESIEVELGEPFSIREGETVDVESSIVKLTFTKVVNDSLCPEDVVCVTRGTLTISIDINGTSKSLSIGDADSPEVEYKDYRIELQKLVYPTREGEKANSNSTYAVQMMITRM